jgi:hypothetical protein
MASEEARNSFIIVVSVVRIKFDCYPISSTFLKKTVIVYKHEILDKLSAYANFSRWSHRLLEPRQKHTGDALARLQVDK